MTKSIYLGLAAVAAITIAGCGSKGGDSSTIAHERRPITFKLRNLFRRSTKRTDVPDAGPCEGTPVAGELDGCVGPAN